MLLIKYKELLIVFQTILASLKESKSFKQIEKSPLNVFLRLLSEKLWKPCPKTWLTKTLYNKKFPDTLKLFGITPVYKKLDPSDKAKDVKDIL